MTSLLLRRAEPVAFVSQLNALSGLVSIAAAGNRATLTDANGKVFTSVYSANSNHLAASVDPNGLRTSFVYDVVGQQLSVQVKP